MSTPIDYKISFSLTPGNLYIDVTLSPELPDENYAVYPTFDANAGAWWITNKVANGFRLNYEYGVSANVVANIYWDDT